MFNSQIQPVLTFKTNSETASFVFSGGIKPVTFEGYLEDNDAEIISQEVWQNDDMLIQQFDRQINYLVETSLPFEKHKTNFFFAACETMRDDDPARNRQN